ncbi:MAG TPA: ISKra4 family transposase [Candidatus Acidoferrum sp.]|nr:ISKra4 family transposase [Candidatus Acidoferrum sp.]
MEMAARRQALRLAARALEQRLNADLSDYAGPQLPCRCGGVAEYHGRHQKTFESVLGPLHLERAYYHCAQCQSGFCPRDRALRMELFSLTPGVLRMTASTAALVSFEESRALLHELAGVEISAKQVERAAEALGAEIANDERSCVEPMGEVAPTMYLGMDGTGVPMRAEEVAGRMGKQADGSAKTREAKVVTVWTAESRDAEGTPMRDPGSITYSAAIESAATADTNPDRSDFAERVLREATRRGFIQAPRCAVLGDGAPWIWNVSRELFPQATQILDRYHAKEALHRAAQLIFGATSESKPWATARCAELDEGKLHAVVHALRSHMAAYAEATKCALYIFHNRARMRYPKFRAQGFCTSTGVLEAGCKVAIGTRLKRAGMHWTVDGANAIIALRCCKLSGRFEDFWERRRDRLAA